MTLLAESLPVSCHSHWGCLCRAGRAVDDLRGARRGAGSLAGAPKAHQFEVGLPPPADDRVRDEDAEVLKLIANRLDLASDDELSRFARLYGDSVQRLVASGVEFFDRAVRQRVAEFDLSNEEKDALVYRKAGGYTELVASIVPWLQRRHREHSVLAYVVSVTEEFMEQRGIGPSG